MAFFMINKTLIFSLFIFLLAIKCAAEENKTQVFLENISAPEVKFMLEKNSATVINVLSKIEYDAQHINGSINIPIISLRTSDKLPKDLTRSIIFYCMGPQ
jgi:hypothetical protein